MRNPIPRIQIRPIYDNLKQNSDLPFMEKKRALTDFVILSTQLKPSAPLRDLVQKRLKESYFNNFAKRRKSLPKNARSSVEKFEVKNSNWLDSDFKVVDENFWTKYCQNMRSNVPMENEKGRNSVDLFTQLRNIIFVKFD